MNLHEKANELRTFGRRILNAADILDGVKKPAGKANGRVLSMDARKRIGDAQRARWAKVKRKRKAA